jgi:hypothetical protein
MSPPKKVSPKKVSPKKVSPQKMADAAAATLRSAHKEARRGKANLRQQFFEETHTSTDGVALHRAMQRVLAEPSRTPTATPPKSPKSRRRPSASHAPLDEPSDRPHRWVPIGPTVSVRGQAMSRPRTSGRIRDLQVSEDGMRAYAASAKGGVWYSDDGAQSWEPVGGWAGRTAGISGQGNMFSCGALFVHFGAGPDTDLVIVGTGEPGWLGPTGNHQTGVGVLAAVGPVTKIAADNDPWDTPTGLALGNHRCYQIVAEPRPNPNDPTQRVLVATNRGLMLGTRTGVAAVFDWTACAASSGSTVTGVVWSSEGRIFYGVQRAGSTPGGLFFSHDLGATHLPVSMPNEAPLRLVNRLSLQAVAGTTRIYILGELGTLSKPGTAQETTTHFWSRMWRIDNLSATPPVSKRVRNVPKDLFGGPASSQGNYDHGLAVEVVGTKDRLYLGGSTVMPRGGPGSNWSASLFCFEVPSAAGTLTMTPVATISRPGSPPLGDGADRIGLIGNNVHADVHSIRLTGSPSQRRQVWVSCDGGVYVSDHDGRVNTFGSRNNGLAVSEPVFAAMHPTSSHLVVAGFQDNGAQVRIGDTMWEVTFLGDGGGSLFHPIHQDAILTQYALGNWRGSPSDAVSDPLARTSNGAPLTDRESSASMFYSGAAAISTDPLTARSAIGTNRVWMSEGSTFGAATWKVLPITTDASPEAGDAARDARPGGSDSEPNFGVPGLGAVLDLAWASPTILFVAYQLGIVRYTNSPANLWATVTWSLNSFAVPVIGNAAGFRPTITSVAPVPNSNDFYVSTLGHPDSPVQETLWFVDSVTGTAVQTGLRRRLDPVGSPGTGPLDPCFSAIVDPDQTEIIYVGTATGAWIGTKTDAVGAVPASWTFEPLVNGLPEATVQDLDIWKPAPLPGGGAGSGPKLLRAAVQSRGLWEVDLSAAAVRRTYVRVHAHDDRRIVPTPLARPRQPALSRNYSVCDSPDILVRPAWPVVTAPKFQARITARSLPTYELWTFQTALRWKYPNCTTDGEWTDAFDDLIEFHRSVLGLPAGKFIDEELWNRVVGSLRLKADPANAGRLVVTDDPADALAPLAVYRAPWQSIVTPQRAGTEIDLYESVRPVAFDAETWVVYNEKTTVDVLLHHRDSRPVAAGRAFAGLLWRKVATYDNATTIFEQSAVELGAFIVAALAAGPTVVVPALTGWTLERTGGTVGAGVHVLSETIEARLPKAVSIDVDLSAAQDGEHVIFVAFVGSLDDDLFVPTAAPTLLDLVLNWPGVTSRVVKVTNR